MSVSVELIESLNGKIEVLNSKRTRLETQKEMLMKQLEKAIEGYEKRYGVSLKGKSMEECCKLVEAEYNKVKDLVEQEYVLKEKVVSLIENGDIEGANSLLNMGSDKIEEPVEEPKKEEPKKVARKLKLTKEEPQPINVPNEVMEQAINMQEPKGYFEEDEEDGLSTDDLVSDDVDDDFDFDMSSFLDGAKFI